MGLLIGGLWFKLCILCKPTREGLGPAGSGEVMVTVAAPTQESRSPGGSS